MTAPVVSDEQFIELWQQHKSVAKISQITGVSMREVNRRRRNLEARYALTLAPKQEPKVKLTTGRVDLEVQNGCILVFGDAHYWPNEKTTAHRALVTLKKVLKPLAIICNGDAFDGSSISRFPQMQWMEKKNSVKDELEACKERLGEIEKDFKGQLIWNLGNHDLRYEARLAATAGNDFEKIEGFHLKDHFPRWKPAWVTWVNDDVLIAHRMPCGVHATHTNVQQAHTSVITGHLHSQKITPYTDATGKTKYGVDHGMLGEPTGEQYVNYLEGKHPNWRSGFVLLTWRDGKLLHPEPITVWDEDHVQFRGHVIHVDTGEIS